MNFDLGVGTSEAVTKSRASWATVRAAVVVALAFIAYAARMFLLISRYAVNIFFSDQWDFNDATLFQHHSVWQIFTWQHGPHRQGIGGLFEKLVDPVFLWNSRTESFSVGGVIVIAAILALYLKYRLFGRLSLTDVVIPAILFTPAQWETLFLTANFAHGPFPLLLLLQYCLAWTSKKRALRYPLVLALNFVTIYTGFGLFLGVLTPGLLALDYWSETSETRLPGTYFGATLAISLLSLGSFFVGYRFNPTMVCSSSQPLRFKAYAAFVDLMFANLFTIEGTHGIYLILGGTLLVAVLIIIAGAIFRLISRQTGTGRYGRTGQLVILAMTAYSLIFCLNAAYGRLCAGLVLALSSRYAIYMEPAMIGLYFQLLNVRRPYLRQPLLSGFLLAVILASFRIDRSDMEHFHWIKQTWKTCYLQTEDIQKCDQAARYPIHGLTPVEQGHLHEKLEFLKQTRLNLYSDSSGK
jgi:hypothetical protein